MRHKIQRASRGGRRLVRLCFVLLFVGIAVWFAVAQPFNNTDTPTTVTTTLPTATPSVLLPTASPTASTPPAPRTPKGCEVQATKAFVPRTASIEHFGVRKVLSLGLANDGTAETPPYDQPDKFGFYGLGSKPGSAKGMVAFNAHTFSQGTWLGNELLAKLEVGDIIIVAGEKKSERLCYVIDKKPAVYKLRASDPKDLPVFPVERVYGFDRPSQLSLTVCSDYDVKNKVWLLRTVWLATPI